MNKNTINNLGIVFLIIAIILGIITIFQVGLLSFSLIMLTETFMAIGVLSYAYGNEQT
jgi:hypothetical protein